MKPTISDKVVIACIAVTLLMLLAVAIWSLATGETLDVGVGSLEVALTSPISVILATVVISLLLAAVLGLFLKQRRHGYLVLGLLFLILASLSLVMGVRNTLQGRIELVDVTFLPLLLFGLLSLRVWYVGRRMARPNAPGAEGTGSPDGNCGGQE